MGLSSSGWTRCRVCFFLEEVKTNLWFWNLRVFILLPIFFLPGVWPLTGRLRKRTIARKISEEGVKTWLLSNKQKCNCRWKKNAWFAKVFATWILFSEGLWFSRGLWCKCCLRMLEVLLHMVWGLMSVHSSLYDCPWVIFLLVTCSLFDSNHRITFVLSHGGSSIKHLAW